MAISRPSTDPHRVSCLPLAYGEYGRGGLMKDAEPGETFGDFGRRHGPRRLSLMAARARRALQHRLRQAVGYVLSILGKIPLKMARPAAEWSSEHAEQHRCSPFAARRSRHLSGTVMTIPMPEVCAM